MQNHVQNHMRAQTERNSHASAQEFDKGIKQHFQRCTGRPRRGRAAAGPEGDVIGEEDEEDVEEDADIRKLVRGPVFLFDNRWRVWHGAAKGMQRQSCMHLQMLLVWRAPAGVHSSKQLRVILL